jgi:hypothetical protein
MHFKYPLVLLSFVLIIFIVTPISFADGLVAYWDFDEGEGDVLLDKVGENHGLLKSGLPGDENLPRWTEGVKGHGLEFPVERQAYVEVAHNPDIKPTHAITIMAWIKLLGPPGRSELVCNKTDTGRYGYRFFYGWRLLNFHISDGVEDYTETASVDLKEGIWYHVAVTFDGTSVKFYLNAQEVGRKEFEKPIKINYSGNPIILGNYSGRKNAYPFHGSMDEVRIFNRALTLREIEGYLK